MLEKKPQTESWLQLLSGPGSKVDHSQNINTQQLFSCWERFEIIIHQTSNRTGDARIEPAAGSHLGYSSHAEEYVFHEPHA